MAVAPTGAIYKALKFDGVSSRTYGVYITGEAVYNAPERDVEMVTIPGRNGTYALDRGRFENIEVSYPAGIFADTEADFRQAISEFRNFLCSRKGYVRLQDEYNPDEYRMAVYKSGLDVDPAQLRAGEFDLTFDCKPQRFLTSGETAVSVESGDTLTNPTLFESGPLFAVTGDGTIRIGTDPNHISEYDYSITLNDGSVGPLILLPSGSWEFPAYSTQSPQSKSVYFDSVSFALTDDTDTITLPSFSVGLGIQAASNQTLDAFTISGFTHGIPNYDSTALETIDDRTKIRHLYYGEQTWTKQTGNYHVEDSFTATVSMTTTNNGVSQTSTRTIDVTLRFAFMSSGAIYIRATYTGQGGYVYKKLFFGWADVSTDSTQSVLGNPTYIDCDLGEAYKLEGGVPVSLNAYIDLGSNLPKLAPGSNTVTYDNTYTEVKVIPRWWRI